MKNVYLQPLSHAEWDAISVAVCFTSWQLTRGYEFLLGVTVAALGLTRLDRFWLNQDIICNFCSEIHGTGSRSEITVKSSLE